MSMTMGRGGPPRLRRANTTPEPHDWKLSEEKQVRETLKEKLTGVLGRSRRGVTPSNPTSKRDIRLLIPDSFPIAACTLPTPFVIPSTFGPPPSPWRPHHQGSSDPLPYPNPNLPVTPAATPSLRSFPSNLSSPGRSQLEQQVEVLKTIARDKVQLAKDTEKKLERRDSIIEEKEGRITQQLLQIQEQGLKIQRLQAKLRAYEDMEAARLQPPPALGSKLRAVQQAKEMEQIVADRAKRSGEEPPPYDFLELIGKGSYGRVFKALSRKTKELVALKIVDIDKVDYEEMTTKNLSDTLKEISILQQLRDSKAQDYVNLIEEALTVHNDLWIISEYASGGSVHTLMKPTASLGNPGLEEKYIRPIARELALGLRYIHEAGVLHRDLKCNNVLINEKGRVELCDFGVSGVLEPVVAKRSTIVGTPYWMAPELQKEWMKDADPNSMVAPSEILYGSEVDIWAYGCTIYEMATGFPPHHTTRPLDLLDAGIPHLEGDRFSPELQDLVRFVLAGSPEDRPIPAQILEHPYLANTTISHPTSMLVELVERYFRWEQGGGARASLFNPYGAQAPNPLAPETEEDDDDWTFSTTDDFEKRLSSFDPFSEDASSQSFSGINGPPADDDRFAKLQRTIREEQIRRGKKKLDRLFDPNSTPYRYSGNTVDRPPSDLILRDFNPGAPNRETVIDLDFAAPMTIDVPSIDLGEVPTLKANRINRLLRDMEEDEGDEERDTFNTFDQDPSTRRATKDWKFPSMQPERPNRRTVEWTFQTAMAEADYEPLPAVSEAQTSRRRLTKELEPPMATAPLEDNRRTRDFVFPPREIGETQGSSLSDQGPGYHQHLPSEPNLAPGFRPSLRHVATEPLGAFGDFFHTNSAPESPLRSSMIDLDFANINDFRPSTAGSATNSAYTVGTDTLNGNPFDLEDQVHLSQTHNRASYHMKTQSEPNHHVPGLLTPNDHDAEYGYNIEHGVPHTNLHARGLSSVSQIQPSKPLPNNIGYSRQRQPPQQSWENGYDTDQSPPTSLSASFSADEASDGVDELWDTLPSGLLAQLGTNGRPVVDFPVPRGPESEALLWDADPDVMEEALLRSTREFMQGLKTTRDLLKAIRVDGTQMNGQSLSAMSDNEEYSSNATTSREQR